MDKDKKTKKELQEIDININTFGQLDSNIDLNKINSFLNQNVADKKFTDDVLKQFEEE